jgi:hypothetical protein
MANFRSPKFALPWLALGLAALPLGAAEPWPEVLSRMPLGPPVTQITWSNAVGLMLPALRSNDVVKALIFLPGATDEFYLYRRARADLTQPAPSLLDAVRALTNQTAIRATFLPPWLLLHTESDRLAPELVIAHEPTAAKLKQKRSVSYACFNDRVWDNLEPFLRKHLKVDIRPWRGSKECGHFYRPCFAAWNLDGIEALETAALATKTWVTIRRHEALFQLEQPKLRPPGPAEWN